MNNQVQGIDLTSKQLNFVKKLLKKNVPNSTVWAYGSRVKLTAKPSSDLDIVVFNKEKNNLAISNLKEDFENGSLPFNVDLFDWEDVPESFRTNIMQQYYILQDNAY